MLVPRLRAGVHIGGEMRLSKFSYYSDFVVYPLVIAVLIAFDVAHGAHPDAPLAACKWLVACLCGLAFWSLLEYFLHRVALHATARFAPMHARHHADPLGFIGTPPWISVAVWLAMILLPLSVFTGINIAGGATVGVMLGYWWYGIVHHVIHHQARNRGRAFGDAYFRRLRAWHMRHHFSPKGGNFGVTTGMWDHLFGTEIRARERNTSDGGLPIP